ncbi:CDP-alcohol phosphatidyltransferase family protein [Blattabacterium cuenoti]|uniref:CDP-alcohol phosphatidyltransferase family protein n=1 Tax=Blattabacterium cuenoti TaxID=1653831 RepID=UPI00163B925C|nr:CDP-alcohol phosphatidyltransferase family protein [Blattabacterium cuenoti]
MYIFTKIIRIIPNILTFLNLFFGCISVIFLQSKNFDKSAVFTLFSIIFDSLDGFFSRLIKNENKFGKELDSLADMVSFGIVPSIIVFLLLKSMKKKIPFIEWSSLFISIFSAYRLAKFNINTSYNGLTTPVNTLFFSSLSIAITPSSIPIFFVKKNIVNMFITPTSILFMIFFSCYLLISKIPMISFNFKGFSWKKNKIRYVFLLISTFLLLTLRTIALPCIIIFYIIISILMYFHRLKKSY